MDRPRGREKHITGPAKQVEKRGSGLGTGPVGAGRGSGQSGGSRGGGGGRRSGGGMVKLILLLAVLLLGGGGGLGALLGGGQAGGGLTAPASQSASSQSGGAALHFATKEEALPELRRQLKPNTAMLVKASHAMRFDQLSEQLRGDFE